eukprot:jgi/Mesvir1/19246/Mv03496-RA.1
MALFVASSSVVAPIGVSPRPARVNARPSSFCSQFIAPGLKLKQSRAFVFSNAKSAQSARPTRCLSSEPEEGELMESAVPKLVERVTQMSKSKPVFVFSKSYCPYSKKAKNLLSSYGVSFGTFELDESPLCENYQKALMDAFGKYTAPQVFVDLSKLADSGALNTMLKDAGIIVN